MVRHLTAVIILAVSLSAWTQAATYGGGTGTAESPYEIWTPEQMNTIGLNPADWGKSFKLMTDINMSIYTGTEYNIIGNSTTKFTGTFDGDGHKISNLNYVTTATIHDVGLFGSMTNAIIENLGIVDVSISTGGDSVGGLAGFCFENCRIRYCYSEGNISGNSFVGGLVGYNCSIIESCFSTGTVIGESYVGGLVGFENAGTNRYCYSAANVSGDIAGGLVGYSDCSTISDCYSVGIISATAGSVYFGGLLADGWENNIISSFWDIQTSGQQTSHGGEGKTTLEMKTLTTFTETGWDFLATDGDPADWWMPVDDYPKLLCNWNPVVPDVSNIPLEEAEAKIEAAGLVVGTITYIKDDYTLPGWIIAHFPVPGTTVFPHTPVDLVVSMIKYGGGWGTFDNPYQIWTAQQMNTIGENPVDWGYRYYLLMADIDMSAFKGTQYHIIGTSEKSFISHFNGQGHKIMNLTYTTTDSINNVGLFGIVGNDGIIENLGLENVTIFTAGDYVGGLAGCNAGQISNCYTSGIVSGKDQVGGLTGYSYDAVIENSYSTAEAEGNSYIGGLAGTNMERSSFIYNCYSTGVVSGYSCVGGLVGDNSVNGNIGYCYSIGAVSGSVWTGGLVGRNSSSRRICMPWCETVCDNDGNCREECREECYEEYYYGTVGQSFWDIQTSGRTSSDGGDGKTTAEMMMQSTFPWIFYGEPAAWMMLREGEDYPRLAWQPIYAGDIAGLYGVDLVDLAFFIEKWLGVWHVRADIVDDSVVNMTDFYILSASWMQTYCSPSPCGEVGIAVDIIVDGTIDIKDLSAFVDQWLFQESSKDCQRADINNDGTVDLADLSILATNWLK
jgi:hypothetical protein